MHHHFSNNYSNADYGSEKKRVRDVLDAFPCDERRAKQEFKSLEDSVRSESGFMREHNSVDLNRFRREYWSRFHDFGCDSLSSFIVTTEMPSGPVSVGEETFTTPVSNSSDEFSFSEAVVASTPKPVVSSVTVRSIASDSTHYDRDLLQILGVAIFSFLFFILLALAIIIYILKGNFCRYYATVPQVDEETSL